VDTKEISYPDLAFVDIETTGSNFERDRITEIGIKTLSRDGIQVLVDSAPGHQETPRPPSVGFSLDVYFGSLAATQPSFKRTLKNVGLPDKLDIRLSSRLQMPGNNHPIPLRATDLGAYATPDLNTLMPLFPLMFNLIFKASKA
jgi:DNA polymerase III epsilon subunit-like protein